MATNHELVREAIIARLQMIATYKGKRREMCPHVLGTKKGRSRALFFQFGGESSTDLGASGQWRCLDIDELESIELIEGEWHSGEGHSRSQSCIDSVEIEVAH